MLASMIIDVRISFINIALYQFTEYVHVTSETRLSLKASLGGRWREAVWVSLKHRLKRLRLREA